MLFLAVGALGLVNRQTEGFLAQGHAPAAAKDSDVNRSHVQMMVPPVSTTMQCIINLTIQYFVVYTALAIVRTYNELYKEAPLKTSLSILQVACTTVNYAPMLSVLFLGTRMRALQLSGGKPDDHGLPQDWVKMCMQACAWSVLVQTLMVVMVPLVMGGEPKVGEDGTPEVKADGSTLATVLTVIRYACMLGMYGGFTGVCVGASIMEAPKSVYPDGAPPVSPAVACTMNLCFQYFAIYLAIAVLQTYHTFNPPTEFTKKVDKTFTLCRNTVSFAPMLCILFIGARMRALQLDPVNGNPQKWAQNCFYMCAYSVLVQVLIILLIPFALNGTANEGETEGDVTFTIDNPTVYAVMNAVRYAVMLAMYGGFTAVIYSVCVIKSKTGPTPPVSPAMQCVMNLTIQFFFIYLVLWVLITVKQFAGDSPMMTTAINTFDSARATVMFCPMLSILFVGVRMRALQITDQKGAPQGWAQQGMFLCTYSLMAQVLMVLILPCFTGAPPKMDADGNVVSEQTGIMGHIMVAIRYLAFLALYGGVVTIVTSLFLTRTGLGQTIFPSGSQTEPA